MGHLLRSVDGLRIRHPSIPGGLSGNTQAHMPCPLRTMPLAGALFAALAGAALATSANAEETVLGTVDVRSTRDAATLHLDQPTQSGSRTGVTAKELPASLEILDSETIRERGDTQMRDTLSRTVGLTDTGRLSFSSRGFTGETSVGIADDGIRVTPGAQTYPGNTWGYERFDISRGPASVVYGTGTVGAMINAIRKEPSRTRSYELMAGLGTDGHKQIGVGGAGPIGEIASYRIDVYGHNDRGFRELGNSRGGKLMSRLRLQPNSDLRIDLTADYSLEHPERYWGTPYGPDGQVPRALRKKNYNINDAQMRYEDTRLRAKVDWQVNDWLGLSNEVYFLESDRLWKNVENYKLDLRTDTVTRTSYVYAHHDHDQRGNRLEARINTAGHRAVLGWEMTKVDFRHTNSSPYGGSSIVSASNPDHGVWNSPDPIRPVFDTSTDIDSVYTEDAWQINDRWLLMAGIRRDFIRILRHELATGGDFPHSLNGTAWRLGLTHHLTRDTSLYGQVSVGHDPTTTLSYMGRTKYRLTTGRQAEVGLKQTLDGGLGEWTAALYRIEKDDIITRDPNNSALSVQGGSMHSQGVELSASISPTRNWRFDGNYTYLVAEYDELNEAVGGRSVSRAGNTPSNVPQHVANLWGHYRFGQWQASLGLRHVGKRYSDNANTLKLKPYTVADASLAWHYDSRTTFRLLARNLADKMYVKTGSGIRGSLGSPRRFDLIAEMKF